MTATTDISVSIPNITDAKACFAPVADDRTRVLLLGTLPGMISLARQEYYANPTNQFWRLIGPAIGKELVEMTYEQRLAALTETGVGLWDVIATADRTGSLDSAIRNYSANPLGDLLAKLPSLRALAFNGGKSHKIARGLLGPDPGVAVVPLPSSSAAYCAIPFEAKALKWLALREFLV